MLSNASLADVLQHLHAKGYRLADPEIAALPNDALQATDWRLDSLDQVQPDDESRNKVLVIAVSSVQRRMKLVFVEVVFSNTNFSPIVLLRRLFPTRRAGSVPVRISAA